MKTVFVRIPVLLMLVIACVLASDALAQMPTTQLISSGEQSDLPRVIANDNRTHAGRLANGNLDIDLELVWADWRIETPDGPGLRLWTIAENGKAPMIPAPLVRIETGTRVRANVRNTHPDSLIVVYGLHSRPADEAVGVSILPGQSHLFDFEAGEQGTYFYFIEIGRGISTRNDEAEQLAGAFVIDPVGGSPSDRVFVMNIFSVSADSSGYLEALTINGLSFPFTEMQTPSVGVLERWRIINASGRNHPMHLHGFYYDILSIGNAHQDNIYAREERRTVVTEFMKRRTTMHMEWIPSREGNWLFHCHLSFHVSSDIRLPTASEEVHTHMAGLVLGINVQPGETDLISEGAPASLTLYANEYAEDTLATYGFSFDPDFRPDSTHLAVPGPIMFLKRHQATYVTVKNRMSIPTGVHWHGLELDSWADGVPNWSASDGKVSPVILPGEEFTYKLSAMRSGTFMYHSHLDDVDQLTGGLYGALIVLDGDEEFDYDRDHIYAVGWNDPEPRSLADLDLNGRAEQPDMYAQVGEPHRLRLINIAPAGGTMLWVLKDGEAVPIRAVAKDGADLPVNQQVDVEVGLRIGVGEAVDHVFTPDEPGIYELRVGPRSDRGWTQKWIVSAAGK